MNPLELVNALVVMETGMGTEKGLVSPASDTMSGKQRRHKSQWECYPKQQQENELSPAILPLLLGGSSNATKVQVFSHLTRIIRGTKDREIKRDDEEKDKRQFDVSAVELESGSSTRSRSGNTKKERSKSWEPIIHYGVLNSTGRLGFAVADADADAEGVIRARCLRRGEML